MSSAMTLIVDAYVKLKDRPALEELQAHRRKLIAGMQTLNGPFDASKFIRENQDELKIIEAGVARLARAVFSLTRDESSRWHDTIGCMRCPLP